MITTEVYRVSNKWKHYFKTKHFQYRNWDLEVTGAGVMYSSGKFNITSWVTFDGSLRSIRVRCESYKRQFVMIIIKHNHIHILCTFFCVLALFFLWYKTWLSCEKKEAPWPRMSSRAGRRQTSESSQTWTIPRRSRAGSLRKDKHSTLVLVCQDLVANPRSRQSDWHSSNHLILLSYR